MRSAEPTASVPANCRFGDFELRANERTLLLDGRPAPLGQRAFDLLLALVERRDRLVGKGELLELVWPGLVVEENNLQVQVSTLRKLLGPQAIATIPGRGYRFTAKLEGAAESAPSAPLATPSTPRPANNLPADLPPLYGRDAELVALRELVLAHKLVTVVGAGGIGKSRLAQACAHSMADRWPDGAWMVELAGLSDPDLVANAVAQALAIKVGGGPAAAEVLVAALATRTALLVLDNCEHLLDPITDLVQAIARGAPNVTLLTTSQEPLRVASEQQYRLVPLDTATRDSGALALFEARVRAVDSNFALNDENVGLAIDICRRLDGLPLAIELAAARVAALGLQPVRDKLDARFKLLTGGARATLRRHQTLRAALEWSHNLLDETECTVFRCLGVFAGGFTVELAQAVAGDAALDEWAVLDSLTGLVDKSLVAADAGATPRYRLLESARAFALEQLAATETSDMLARHAAVMRDFIVKVDDANLDGELRTDQYAALVLPELDNLRAAYGWATGEGNDPALAVALAAHAGSLVDYAAECAQWLLALQRHVEAGAVNIPLAARYWRALAAGNMAGRTSLALQAEAAQRACALYRSLGLPRRLFGSLLRFGFYRRDQGEPEAARAAVEEARGLIEPGWPLEFRIQLVRRDGVLARSAGRFAEALALTRDSVRLSAASKDWRLEVIARTQLIDLLWEAGPIEEAAREARMLATELRTRPAAPSDTDVVLVNLVGIASELGALDEAKDAARQTLPIIVRTRVLYLEEWVYLFYRCGLLDAAALLLGACDAAVAKLGVPPQTNERRLLAQVRSGLAAALTPETFAAHLASGAASSERDLVATITQTLAAC